MVFHLFSIIFPFSSVQLKRKKKNQQQTFIECYAASINNLRYADGTTIMAEREEELKSLLMKVKEESENVGLKLNI